MWCIKRMGHILLTAQRVECHRRSTLPVEPGLLIKTCATTTRHTNPVAFVMWSALDVKIVFSTDSEPKFIVEFENVGYIS